MCEERRDSENYKKARVLLCFDKGNMDGLRKDLFPNMIKLDFWEIENIILEEILTQTGIEAKIEMGHFVCNTTKDYEIDSNFYVFLENGMGYEVHCPSYNLPELDNWDDLELINNIDKWVDKSKPDIVIIASGDSDYFDKLKELKAKGLKVGIASKPSQVSKKNMNGVVEVFINLEKYKHRIMLTKEKASQRYYSKKELQKENTKQEKMAKVETIQTAYVREEDLHEYLQDIQVPQKNIASHAKVIQGETKQFVTYRSDTRVF